MDVVAYLVRSDLRRRWRSWTALALLLAVAGGVSMFAIAGWQRTATAMDRFLVEYRPGDAIVVGTDLDREVLLDLPGVAAVEGGEYFFLAPDGPDGRPDPDALGEVNPISSAYGTFFEDINVARVVEGSVPDDAEELEIAIDEELASAYDVGPGDTFTLTGVSVEQVTSGDDGQRAPDGPRFDFEVTGIVRRPSDVVPSGDNEADVIYLGTRDLYLTPAFHAAHFGNDVAGGSSYDEPGYGYLELRFAPDADTTTLPDRIADALPGAQTFFDESEDATATRVSDRAIGLQATALLAFGVVVAVAAALLTLLATSRLLGDQATELDGLRASGLSRTAITATAALSATLVAVAGSAGAVALAMGLSPLSPIGLARRAEPSPGFDIDPVVLVVGVTLGIVLTGLAATGAAVRAQALARRPRVARRASLAARLARRSNRLDVSTGLQLGSGASRVGPATQLAVALACIGIVGTLVFAASAERLQAEPEAFGWTWDLAVGNPNDGALFERVVADVGDHPAVSAATVVHSGCGALLEHGGRKVEPPLVGLEALRGTLGPAVLAGRAPSGIDEVALGAVTARALSAELGDTVMVGSGDCGGEPRPLELVGLVLFNRALLADRVGEGALVDQAALDAIGVETQPGVVVVNKADAVGLDEARGALQADFGRTVLTVLPPDDLGALNRIRGLPTAVAAFLGVLAMATLVFTLGSVLRTNRRDVAVLKTIGLTPAQAGRAVLVHAVSLVLAPAVLGTLLGVVAGRLAWGAVSDGLGVPDLPVVPILTTTLAVPMAILAAATVAIQPARQAATTAPSTTLRAE